MENQKQTLAKQAVNAYKGKVCFYADVTRKDLKEKDPALAFSKTSNVYLNIFDPASQKSTVFYISGTIPALIYERTRISMAYRFWNKMAGGQKERPSGAAYHIKLKKGKFKDKTPAELLTESPDLVREMWQYYQELCNNLNNPQFAKYRKGNEEQARAIHEAVALFQSGKLASAVSYPKITIWDGTRTPDISKTDPKGNTEARSINITFDTNPGNEEPYSVEIMNCMAPPVQGSQVGAKLSQAVDKVFLSMTFTEEIWFGIWEEILAAKRSFARLVESDRILYSEKNMWRPDSLKGNNSHDIQQNISSNMINMPNSGYYQGNYSQSQYPGYYGGSQLN